MTLEFQLDEFHGDGELVDVHTTITVHISQSPEKVHREKVNRLMHCYTKKKAVTTLRRNGVNARYY